MTTDDELIPERPFLATWARVGFVAVILVGLAVVGTLPPVHTLIVDSLAAGSRVIATRPGWGALLFVLLSAAAAMVAFFSTSVLVPVAIVTWSDWVTLVLLWLGWIVGGIVAYAVGRWLGRGAVKRLTSGRALAYADRISTTAPFGLVLLFQLGLPSEIPGYILGLVRYSFAKYFLALALAELPYAVVTVYLGVSFLQGHTEALAILAVLVLVFAGWTFQTLHHRLVSLGRAGRDE